MTSLPQSFLSEMERLLGWEYQDWLALMEDPGYTEAKGLRTNSLKITPETFEDLGIFGIGKVPWTDNGFYTEADARPALHPYYAAGLYYIQEPSAMFPAAALPVEKGERVLDLCAAPGGKATELAARLGGTGLLAANDVSASRTAALLKNLELSGADNILVTSESPERLAGRFEGFFDKILVDAPCSGEAMLRTQPSMAKDYLEKGPSFYKEIQHGILMCAARMLRPGGMLLYSTCTFSAEENEGNVLSLLREARDLEVLPSGIKAGGLAEGRPDLLDGREISDEEKRQLGFCVRLYPHRVRGAGHFAALMRKQGGRGAEKAIREDTSLKKTYVSDKNVPDGDLKAWREFAAQLNKSFDEDRLFLNKGKLYLLPDTLEPSDFKGLRTVRCGLLLGEIKNKRFEPSQALAMSLKKDDFTEAADFAWDDGRVRRYLKGETLDEEGKGVHLESRSKWRLVCVDGYPLGWAKEAGGRLKNKYRAGWRW